jgi:glyoxylase-like metal-dependent hydrolase (beta-lactamase superfamily II)
MFEYEKLVLGELATNCYLLWDSQSREAAVIDAADSAETISEEIEKRQLKLKYVISTHGHFDHNLAALDLKLIYQVPFCASQKDFFLLARQQESANHFLGAKIQVPNFKKIDIDLDKTESLSLGEQKIKIIKTSGHTPGGVSILADKFLFDGDLIFTEGVRGDTRHQYSSDREMFRSICKVLELPDEVEILPGHGETTTVAKAREMFNCQYGEWN